ncbi:MAG: hypothetical protein H6703_12555 [Myxococcales bacterium]|nr:hypothetical protein [Myxococcales bacterium]
MLADEAVVTAERVAATQALREADAALRQAAPALADADPRLAERRSPAPRLSEPAAGEVVLRYWIEPDAGHLWILEPGKAPEHYDLPGAAKLAAALAPARAAIEEAPAAWPAQKRGARDPNAADWKALATAARVALPFVGDAKVMAALGAARVRVVPHGPLVGFPLDALVVEAPRGKVDGAAPAFVGAALHLTYSLPPRLPAADRSAAAAFGLFGPPGPGAACPVERCAGPDPAADALAEAMRDVEGFARVDGPAATRVALGAALMGTSTLLLAAPVDPAEATFVTAPAPGEDGYGRFGGAALAATPAAADAVVVLHPAWSTWPALDAALRAAGVEVAIGAVGAVPAAAAARLGARLASGTPIRSAVLAVKRDGLTAQVDPEVGGEAGHHPYFWARWLVFGEPVDRAALEAAIKPLPAPPVAPIDPYGSDAAAPGGGAAPEAAPVDPYDAGGAAPAEDAPPVDPYGEAAPVGDGG